MSTDLRPAAQYIRMSTDRQDLSPWVQKEAIERFARDNSQVIVCTYQDEGRSGVQISNRPGLQQLMHDVSEGASYQAVLVYDVSRWGRFQDSDASAYYEYHCRLHGVQVIYVAEPFGDSPAPVNALLKSMKRVMAAEYSRDLGVKTRAGQTRVINMGYQMGPLPALGYRRCSVSSDGKRRTMLEMGQRKLALTDRIQWVLAPDAEVELVRRICDAYARSSLDLWQIARMVTQEGWFTVRGGEVGESNLRDLLRNEALIGNFVWGISGQNLKRRIIHTPSTRRDGSVPRIIDGETWELIQRRLARGPKVNLSARTLPRRSHRDGALQEVARLKRAQFTQAHQSMARRIVAARRTEHAREMGVALAHALNQLRVDANFDRKLLCLHLGRQAVALKLMWRDGEEWWVPRIRSLDTRTHVLLVQMEAEYQPGTFYLVPMQQAPSGDAALGRLATDILPFRRPTSEALVDDLRALAVEPPARTSGQRALRPRLQASTTSVRVRQRRSAKGAVPRSSFR